MPSVTSLSQYSLVNVGPLTTTWTSPASCTDGPSLKYLAPAEFPELALYRSNCTVDDNEYFSCAPYGQDIESLWDAKETSPATVPYPLPYHSPGTICPSGWTTVGAATKSSNGDTDADGHFTQAKDDFVGTASHNNGFNPPQPTNPVANILLEALTPGESILLCCPSGYKASNYGGCYRNFPVSDFPSPTACMNILHLPDEPQESLINVTFTYDGERVTADVYTPTGTAVPSMSTLVETYPLSDLLAENPETVSATYRWPIGGSLTGCELQAMVTLVNGPNDTSSSGEEESETTETGESAAHSGRLTFGAGVGALMAAWGAAAVIGVGLMMPW